MNRILICARGYPPDVAGGGEISTELIARGLKQLGADVHVLTFTQQESRVDHVNGVQIHRLKCPNIYWSILASEQPPWKKLAWHLSQSFRLTPPLSIRQAIEGIQPSILHSSTIEDFGPGLWRWAKSQGLVTVHSLRSYNLLHRQGTLYDAKLDREIGTDFLSLPKSFYAKALDGVIGISQCILNKHLENGFFPHAKTTVIGNPIDEPIDIVTPQTAFPIRMGILGRIAPEKGIENFLQSLSRVRNCPPWSLEIAGMGEDDYIAKLRHSASNMPVKWKGWQSSREFLASLDLLVVPSRWHEPFGRIVVEAYSIGLPVLCLRRGAMPELVIEGKTGWIVEQWAPHSIESAIANCRMLDRKFIRSTAEKYTVTEIAQQHLAFYRKLAESI